MVFAKEKSSNSTYIETAKPAFNLTIDLPATTVKDQHNTGTCWSYSTISMLESEIVRKGNTPVDLSEKFIIKNVYNKKAERYIRMHGNIKFGSGGAFNDVTNIIEQLGIVPENVYGRIKPDTLENNDNELDKLLKDYLHVVLENSDKTINTFWEIGYTNILDNYLGTYPELFAYNGEVYTPGGFARDMDIHPEDYVLLTSFSHHPYYQQFALEVPDNWSGGTAYNVKLNELVRIADNALKNDITFVWATDITEKGFDFQRGLAVAPAFLYNNKPSGENTQWIDLSDKKLKETIFNIDKPLEEVEVTAALRQKGYDNHTTTDDHGMHVTGMAFDTNGKKYYYVKNSWGTSNPYEGYLYVSEAYFKLKTISIMVHKDAIPGNIKKKLNIK